MLLPRLLLHRPARGGMVPRKKLEERVSCFQEGWLRLLEESQSSEAQAHQASSRRRRNQVDEQGIVSGPAWRVVCCSGCSGGSRSRTKDVDNFEGVDKSRTPTSQGTSRVESRDVRTPLPNSGQYARFRGSRPSCNVDGEGRGARRGIGGHQIGKTHCVKETGRRREGHCCRRHFAETGGQHG